jgi:hypothetical protein
MQLSNCRYSVNPVLEHRKHYFNLNLNCFIVLYLQVGIFVLCIKFCAITVLNKMYVYIYLEITLHL